MRAISGKVLFCVSLLVANSFIAIAQQARLVVQTGHSDSVHSVAFSPDGKTLASGSEDKTVRLWEVSTGTELRTLTSFARVNSVAFSPDGKILACSSSNTIKLWDVSTGAELRTLYVQSGSLLSIAFSPDGRTLASILNTTLKLWDVSTGKELATFNGHLGQIYSLSFSPDGKTLASGDTEGTIKLWNFSTGSVLRTIKAHSWVVNSVAFSPDGNTLASGGAALAISGTQKVLKLWDVRTGAETRTLAVLFGSIMSVTFSPGGKILASGGSDHRARLWDVSSGSELRTLSGHLSLISSIAFSPDGRTLASGSWDKTVQLWDVSSATGLRTLKGRKSWGVIIAFSPDGKTFASAGDDNTAKIWDASTGRAMRTLNAHSNSVNSVAFSPDGRTLATGSSDKTVKFWNVSTGAELRTLKRHSDFVISVAFSPDGKTLASGSGDNTVKVWNVSTGTELRSLTIQPGTPPRLGYSPVFSVAFSPDGKTLASGGGDNTIKLWDFSTGAELQTLRGHTFVVSSVAFSPNGKILASGSWDTEVKLWDVSSGTELHTLQGHQSSVHSVAFSSDGKFVASGNGGNTLKLWEVSTGAELRTLQGHSNRVYSVAFTPNNKYVVSGSGDTTIKVWDAASGKELASLFALEQDDWAVVTPEGQFDASTGSEKLMHYVLNTPERGYEVISFNQLKLRYYEPGLLQKIFKRETLRDVSAFRDVRLTPDVQEVKSSSESSANPKRTIKLTNRGGGIGRVQVYVNDREFIEDARDRKLRQNPEVNEAFVTFDLKGASVILGEQPRVKVIAWNYDPQAKDKYKGYISSRGTELVYTPAAFNTSKPPTKPELYAIIGGVSDYDGDKLDLRFAAKDAEDIAKAITVGGKNLFGVERMHITLLATGLAPAEGSRAIAATKENFQKAFAAYAKQAKPEDIFFVYFSGHGITLGHGSDTYLYLTKDANTTDVDQLKKDSDLLTRATISSDELKQWFKSVSALKQVLVLDTCAAGAAAAKLSSGAKDVQTDAIRAIDQMQDVTGFHVLMGSTADAVSYEATQYGQGLLTYSLLQGIKSGEALEESGRVDVSRLFQYAANKVPLLARNLGGIQRPEIRGPSGDGKSFALGLISSIADKKEIPLESPKPLILRPVLQHQKLGYDNLKLTALLRDALREASYATVRGRDVATLVFVDADEMPDAIIPSGNYTIEGETVRVTLNLVRNDEVLKSFTVEGQRNGLSHLVKQLLANFTAVGIP